MMFCTEHGLGTDLATLLITVLSHPPCRNDAIEVPRHGFRAPRRPAPDRRRTAATTESAHPTVLPLCD